MTGTVPDVPGVVVGWRTWQVRGPGPARLRSPVHVGTEWRPGTPLAARCELRGHAAPEPGCTCGLYAAQDPADVGGVGFGPVTVLGCVALWGTVVEGERGWRGGLGVPVVLFCGPSLPEPVRAELADAYRVGVHALHRPVAATVEQPGVGAAAEPVRAAAAAPGPDARLVDDAARAFVAACRPAVAGPAPSGRARRRGAVGTAVVAAVVASVLLFPPTGASAPPAPITPGSAAP